ncbi:transmembrane amino acid transporter protein-domain-containing protein [Circinella umbellata]|nr:transmembrane amino acid transporter protein-domain-containing protein [Circinella umbellata]
MGEKSSIYSVSSLPVTVESVTTSYEYHGDIEDIDRSKAGSSFYAYWNIVCAICGIGILGLPQALSRGGWGAVALLLVTWWMTTYSAIIVVRCLYHPRHQKKRLTSFTAVAEEAFGKIGAYLLFFFQAWIVLGGPVLFVVLCGNSMNELCEGTVAEIGRVPWTIIFSAIVAIPFVFFKTMKDMGWTSVFGTIGISVIILICVIMSGIDSPRVSPTVTHNNVVWEGFPVALSSISLSFGASVLYPNIEASMKRPQDWTVTITAAIATCALLYIMCAVAGYYAYGDSVLNPVYYSMNSDVLLKICLAIMVTNGIVSAPIYLVSFTIECEEKMNITVERWGRFRERLLRFGFRILTIVFCAVIGCTVPYFNNLMALFGAIGYCSTTFLFPVLCYWRLTGIRNKPFYILAWDALILLFGIVGTVFGTWFAVEDLIAAFENDK